MEANCTENAKIYEIVSEDKLEEVWTVKVALSNREFFIYIGLITMEFESWFLTVIDSNMFYYAKIITVLIFVISICFQENTINYFALKIIITIIGLNTYRYSHDDLLLYFVVAIFALQDVDLAALAKIDLAIKSICIPCVMILYFLKIIPSYDFVDIYGRTRYSFGYYNPNGFFFGIFVLCIDAMIISGNTLKYSTFALISLTVICFGYFTYSRSGIIMLLATFLLITIENRYDVIRRSIIIKFVISYGLPICYLIAYLMTMFYERRAGWVIVLSKLMSGRIRFSYNFLQQYGVSLFGQEVYTNTSLQASENHLMAVSLDNFYIYSLICYGIVFSLILIILSVLAEKKLIKYGYSQYAIILFMMAIYSFSEKIYISFETNVWVALLCFAFSNENTILQENGRNYITCDTAFNSSTTTNEL